MASALPLTIQSTVQPGYGAKIVIGKNYLTCPSTDNNLYWVVVMDRKDASVKENFTFSANDSVPPQLKPYLGNSEYVLILATQTLQSANLPTGAWHDYLVDDGAGACLLELEQIFATLNCGTWGWMAYCLVTVMGDKTMNGFECSAVQSYVGLLNLQLMPVTFGKDTLYTPVSLSSVGHGHH